MVECNVAPELVVSNHRASPFRFVASDLAYIER